MREIAVIATRPATASTASANRSLTSAELATALADGAPERAYLGFVGDEGEDGVRRAYPPATLERLARAKRRYDPDNLFHLNLNVVPDAAR